MKFTFLFLSLGLFGCLPEPDYKNLYVSRVIDGDTFIAGGKTVRLWGIDAPEEDEPYYQTAILTLEGIVEERALDCNLIERDKYKRDVMRCYNAEGEDIAVLMVQEGMAKNVTRSLGEYYQREEANAEKNKRGIWSD